MHAVCGTLLKPPAPRRAVRTQARAPTTRPSSATTTPAPATKTPAPVATRSLAPMQLAAPMSTGRPRASAASAGAATWWCTRATRSSPWWAGGLQGMGLRMGALPSPAPVLATSTCSSAQQRTALEPVHQSPEDHGAAAALRRPHCWSIQCHASGVPCRCMAGGLTQPNRPLCQTGRGVLPEQGLAGREPGARQLVLDRRRAPAQPGSPDQQHSRQAARRLRPLQLAVDACRRQNHTNHTRCQSSSCACRLAALLHGHRRRAAHVCTV